MERLKGFIKRISDRLFDGDGTSAKGYVLRFLAAALVAMVIAGGLELVYSRDLIFMDGDKRDVHPVEFSLEEYVDAEGETKYRYVASFETTHVDKIRYSYETEYQLSAELEFFNADTGAAYLHPDNNNRFLNESVHKISAEVNQVRIINPRQLSDNRELIFGEDVIVTGFSIDNTLDFNYRRFLVVFTLVFLLASLLLCSKLLSGRLELTFLIMAVGMGISYFVILPTQKVAWDEGIHFRSAYSTTLESYVGYNDTLLTLSDDGKVWPLNIPQTVDEYQLQDDILDASITYDKSDEGVVSVENSPFKFSRVGYLPSGLGLTIGRLLKLDFTAVFFLGRFFNFITYVALAYLAIRRCRVGKVLMTILALMPTLMVTACAYSRDAVMNGLALVTVSYLLAMFVDRESYVTWKDYIIFAASTFLFCSIKALYAPLALLVLIVPKDRFKDKKTMYMMKGGVFLIALLLCLSFMAPAVTNSEAIGDPRGGNTSGASQMSVIFGAPVAYARLLLESIVNHLFDYLVGNAALGEMGHVETVLRPDFIMVLMLFVAITDRGEERLSGLLKLGILAVSFVVICFVWTSMYLSFTEVGAPVIAGVQGRYFIPLVYPLLLLFNTDKIKVSFNKRWYSVLVVAAVVAITYDTLWSLVITNLG